MEDVGGEAAVAHTRETVTQREDAFDRCPHAAISLLRKPSNAEARGETCAADAGCGP
jgi:hypothetical protein